MLPKIIDLFSGCGGLSLGFEKAGFDIVAGVELMPEACQTISYNLDFRYGKKQTHICGDITELDASIFEQSFGSEGCIVIGGPPCQAYSRIGRAKLRSLGDDRINTKDSRGYLFQDFLRFVYDLDARAVVMENVPEAVSYGEMNIPEIVCSSLSEHGYNAYWTVLNSADYGVPQVRERIIVVGIKQDINKSVELPIPTNQCLDDYQTPISKRFESFKNYPYFKMPLLNENAPHWVTIEDAFSDLPVLFPTIDSKYRNVKLNEELDYAKPPQNDYQVAMRTWYGEDSFSVTGNAFRNNKRDFAIFDRMKQGDNYLDASRIADEIFEEEARVFGYKENTEEYAKLRKKMVPIYDREKFEGKWKRLTCAKPAHTLIAHLSKDTYSHIHPIEPRGISVREAARIQSFPDDFFFDCSMGDAFKQIGNAVPPLLAFAVANTVRDAFNEE